MSSSVPDFSLEARKALADAATALGGVESEPVVHAQGDGRRRLRDPRRPARASTAGAISV